MKLTIICIILCALPVLAQKEITKDDYLTPMRKASQDGRALNRRRTTTIELFKNGKLIGTEEWIYEYDLPDKIRYVFTKTNDGKSLRIEEIDIGTTKYCKKEGGEWSVVKSYCIGGSGIGGPSQVSSIKYSVEEKKLDGKKVKLFTQHILYKNIYSPNKDTEGLSYWDSKYWLNKDGLIVKEERTMGLVQPQTLSSRTTDVYEFDKKIKVEAPIK